VGIAQKSPGIVYALAMCSGFLVAFVASTRTAT
jgi:hypothetical protein